MDYFSIKRPIFIVPSEKCSVEFEKIDKFMILLEKSGVGKIIEYVKYNDKKCKGRRGYNPYNLFAAIVYCFAAESKYITLSRHLSSFKKPNGSSSCRKCISI